MEYINSLCERLCAAKYAGRKTDTYELDCVRLRNGEPYEYVLGHTDFLGARIDLSLKPMIPRPETAFWVARAIEELEAKEGALRLADTFAGSGNVGIALLLHLPNAVVDITEVDPTLKAQIEANIALNEIDSKRVNVITASVLDGLTGTYDAIFAVPPYVPYEALPQLDAEMVAFEPHLAFFAHDNGHEFHKALIEHAWSHLNVGGTLYMEADMDHNDAIQEMVRETSWSKLDFWPDPYGAIPNVVLRK